MISLSQLLASIDSYLKERSSVPDEDYQVRKKHFNKVSQHLKNNDYSALIKEIDAGIEEFHHIFTSNRYSNYLSELKNHLVPENSEDAEKRLRKLLVAALKNDTKGIADALENGGLAVINSPYQGQENIGVPPETTPVMAAFATKQFAACAHLFKQLDVIERQKVIALMITDEKNLNPILDRSTQYSLLHFAAEYGLTDLLHSLLPHADSFDINAVDANNATALFLACVKGEEENVDILLDNNANPNTASAEITPLWVAFHMNNPRLVKTLIKHGAEVTEAFYYTTKNLSEQDSKYKEIFKVIHDQYAEKILRKLLIAVLKNDIEDIDEALEIVNLSDIYTNYYQQKNIKESKRTDFVMVAFKSKRFSTCAHLLNKLDAVTRGKVLYSLIIESGYSEKNPNPILSQSTKYSLLHFAAEHGLTELLHIILPFADSFDINALDANNATALSLACARGQEKAAVILLNNHANPNIASSENPLKTALVELNNPRLVKELINHGAEVTRAFNHGSKILSEKNSKYKETSKIIQDHYHKNIVFNYKNKKRDIINQELVHRTLNPTSENFPAFASQMYFENPDKKAVILKKLTECLSTEDQILQPLLTIIAFAKTSLKQKPLRTIVNNQSNLENLFQGGEHGVGVYRSKKAVYIAGKNQNTLGTILHEWKHFVDKAIFGNGNTTFTESARSEFELVKESVQKDLHHFPEDPPIFLDIKNSLRMAFEQGRENPACLDAELLARVPEILGTLGVEQGREWLQTYTPRLLKFFENEYNNSCNRYIADRQPPSPESPPSFVS